jgi:hypothetical protein
MNEFIYLQKSLSIDICNKIINLYNKEGENIKPGKVASGINKSVKDTSDFVIPININNTSCWYEINDILSQELKKNLDIYLSNIKQKYNMNLISSNFLFV